MLKNVIQNTESLLIEKRKAYGNAFFQSSLILKALYPKGIPLDSYNDALTIVRICDKLFRIANSQGKPDLMNEDPWQDIAGYAILALEQIKIKEKQNEPVPKHPGTF